MIYKVYIPLALLFVPWLLVRFVFVTEATRALAYRKHALYLIAAAVLWELAMVLPNIPVSPETDSFTMHAMGGVVAVVLAAYTVKVYNIKRLKPWWLTAVIAYFFVSGLGVLNELFELFLNETGLATIPNGDTWWDLLANTVGATLAFIAFQITGLLRKK